MLNRSLQSQTGKLHLVYDEPLQALDTLVFGLVKTNANIRDGSPSPVGAVQKRLAHPHLLQEIGTDRLGVTPAILLILERTALALPQDAVLDDGVHGAPVDALAHHDGGLDDVEVAGAQEAKGQHVRVLVLDHLLNEQVVHVGGPVVEGLDGAAGELLEVMLVGGQDGEQLFDEGGILSASRAGLAVFLFGGRHVLVLDRLLVIGGLVGLADFNKLEANGPEGAELGLLVLGEVAHMAGLDLLRRHGGFPLLGFRGTVEEVLRDGCTSTIEKIRGRGERAGRRAMLRLCMYGYGDGNGTR